MKNNVKKNYIFNTSYQIFALFVPLITTPYISRVLGVEGIGIYSYTYSMVRYFWLLAALGLATLGIRTIGVCQDDVKKRTYNFWNLFVLRAILGSIMIGIYLLYVYFIANNKLISLIQGIYLVGVIFDISWFYQGIEDFKKVAIRNFIIKIINIIYVFLFVKKSTDLGIYVFGLAFFTLIGNLYMWIYLKKYIQKINIRKLNPFENFKKACLLFIPSVATQLFSVFDKSMIGWFTNNSLENGYYEQALKIIEMTLVVITTLSTVMIPKMSKEYAEGNIKGIKKHLQKSFQFTFMLSIPMVFGILTISDIFVRYFFGPEFQKSSGIINILSLLYIFMGINSVTGTQYLIATSQEKIHTKLLLIGGGINIILNYFLIPNIYSYGAAIATVSGEIVITILELRYLNKTNQYSITSIIKDIYKYIISGVAMFIVILILKYLLDDSIKSIIIIPIIGAIIYLTMLILLKDELILEEIKVLKRKLKIGDR